MGVYPGEGKGEELTPALTPIVWVGTVGKPVSTVSDDVPTANVNNVHCKKEVSRVYTQSKAYWANRARRKQLFCGV